MKQRVLIFEGPDRSGKTTVAKLVAEKLEIPYFKYAADKKALSGSDMTSLMLRIADPYLVDFLKQTGHSAIIDRQFPSEWAYAQALGRDTDFEGIRQSDELFSQIPVTIVLLKRKSYEGVTDDDPRLNSERLELIKQKYEEFVKWSKCKVLSFEFDSWDPEKMTKEIIERINRQ